MRLAVMCAALALPLVAGAQSADSLDERDRPGRRSTEVWAGYSDRSPKWGVLGNRPGMRFAIAAGRISRRVKTTERYALDYTFDVIPLAVSSPPLGYERPVTASYLADLEQSENCPAADFECRFPEGSAYGAGVSPLGFTAIYRRGHAVQPRIGATGGILLFDRAVPTVISTKLNFTASVEAGVQLLTRGGNGVLAVYRFHHLSNAGTGYDNSALASHVISVGARWRTGQP